MYATNVNPDNYQVIYPGLTNAQQAEYLAGALDREIDRLVDYCRSAKQDTFILDTCLGISYRAVNYLPING